MSIEATGGEPTPELSLIEILKAKKQEVRDTKTKADEAKENVETKKKEFEEELRAMYQGQWVRFTGSLDGETYWDNGDYVMGNSHSYVSDYEGYVTGAWPTNSGRFGDKDQPILYISKKAPSIMKQGEVRVELFNLDSIVIIEGPGGKEKQIATIGRGATAVTSVAEE